MRVANRRVSLGRQACYGKGHGDTVISVGLNLRSAQFSSATAFDLESVWALLHGRAHAAQILRERGDPVAFFHSQLVISASFDPLFSMRALGVGHRHLG